MEIGLDQIVRIESGLSRSVLFQNLVHCEYTWGDYPPFTIKFNKDYTPYVYASFYISGTDGNGMMDFRLDGALEISNVAFAGEIFSENPVYSYG